MARLIIADPRKGAVEDGCIRKGTFIMNTGPVSETISDEPTGPTGGRILVVDDDAVQRAMVRETLDGAGFATEEAVNGLEGLSKAEEFKPDLVILDVMMPELDGFATCSLIRKTPEIDNIPVLMVTGLDDVASVERAFDSGATNFMTKPIHWNLFHHHIRYMLRSSWQEKVLQAAMIEAQQGYQAKSEFLASMSHELRTPLNAIIGFSEMIEKESVGPVANAKYLEYAAHIHQSGAHLLGVINDVLDFSKLEAGRMVLNESNFNLANVVQSAVNQMIPLCEKADVRLRADIASDLPGLRGDELKLRQILLNLLSNAIKFTPAGGQVCIEVDECENGDIHLSVADTGIGIAKEDLHNIFDAFVQVDGSLHRTYDGTGLGVPLAMAMAKLHNGTLAIDSALGVGTTVRVILPAKRAILWQGAA